MNNWERFNEKSFLNKESFYSNLNMENTDDIDYRHGNNAFKRLKFNKAILYYWLMYLKTLEIRALKHV